MASPTSLKECTVTAPGKVLLAGGYLVLESPNVGLVVAADKRFYCSVSPGDSSSIEEPGTAIAVHSPQFHTTWHYQFKISTSDKEGDSFELWPSQSNISENCFVEKTLRIVLGYLWQFGVKEFPPRLEVVIRADNDFYSVLPHLEERKWEATPENVSKLPKFLPCPVVDGKPVVNKTGLGSSAALVTSLVGALLEAFGATQLPSLSSSATSSRDSLLVAHNLAQICHCHAQGKVGSGFDVSSAVFGSHVYRRFPKCILPELLNSLDRDPRSLSRATAQMLHRLTQESWSGGVQAPLTLPGGLELLLADVCGGSESPSMARKVLSWKQCRGTEDDASQPYWENLAEVNKRIVSLFDQLSSSSDRLEKHASVLSQLNADQWTATDDDDSTGVIQMLLNLRRAFEEARTNLKAMGDAAGVPIEPEEQTALADATMKLPGVVAAIVPGAGGYDAMACLYICSGDGAEVRNRIGKLWASWGNEGEHVCPLGVKSSSYGEGLREIAEIDANPE